jgi:hypothetical protein
MPAARKGTAIMTAGTQMSERRELTAEELDDVSGGSQPPPILCRSVNVVEVIESILKLLAF